MQEREDAPRDGYMPKAAFITVCSFVLGILRGETVNEAHARIIEANRSLQAATEERLEPLQGKPNDKPVRGFRQAPTNKER